LSAASSPGYALRSGTRVLAGLLIVALGMTGAVLVIAATGGLRLDAWLIGLVLVMTGFASLAVTRVALAPLRPTRIALAIAVVLAGCMLLALPWPPGPSERTAFLTLMLGIALSLLGASLVGSRSSRGAIVLLALLGGYGIYTLVRMGYTVGVGSHAIASSHPGPVMTTSLVLAESLATAWIAACWHARFLWPALRRLPDRAT
jgi:hypothetical protein